MTENPSQTRDYSETLFLPKTDFPMRAGLPQKEPELLARWNEIATTLSQSGPRPPVTVPVPASDFFLQDVEKVVDRILIKNSLHVAS